MFETAVALFCGHLLADFVFQTNWIVQHKKRAEVMALHVFIVVALTAVCLGSLNPLVLGVVLATHLAMDLIKVWRMPDTLLAFGVDQAVHLLVIAGLVVACPDTAVLGLWGRLPADAQNLIWPAMAIVAGLIVTMPAGGLVMRKLTTPLAPRLNPIRGMPQGGRWIGWLERGLIFAFVFYGHLEGVGFLLTAKSILRFGDITDQKKRVHTEYIIIGTMLSFGWGLVVAMTTLAAVHHWLP